MPKLRTRYQCQQCQSVFPKWSGRCPECGEWNSLVETVVDESKAARARTVFLGADSGSQPQRLGDVAVDGLTRIELPTQEFNRVLGGGIVPGSLVLIGGDPGIGKSTLLLQVSALMSRPLKPVLYVSGEESVRQIKLRADRLDVDASDLYLLSETNLNVIMEQARQLKPRLLIVDSIQAVYLDELESTAGSVTQVRESAARLMQLAKGDNIPIFVVGHVTKAGAIAGP
ncbi:MAG: AAA family ATPase, partial [Anaerolineae bacterium]|nr:AAA family ATPase [Anaerolineae bacterium]